MREVRYSNRMKKNSVAYLCCQSTITSSSDRRSDAFEHDLTLESFRPEFDRCGIELTEVCWDSEEAQWSAFDAVVIGTTWDYWDHYEKYLATLDTIESQTRLFNSASMARWNSNKQYLKELAGSGANLIPTRWIDEPTPENVEAAFDELGCDDMVIKRQIGANADGQHRLKRGDVIPKLDQPMMAQPFFPSIQTEGEMSLIYVDGQFSHALIKRAVAGDYRIQSSYGGTEEAISVSVEDRATAAEVLAALDETPLYARVDMLRAESGELYLMELELIEPYLYPVQGPELGRSVAAAVKKRLT